MTSVTTSCMTKLISETLLSGKKLLLSSLEHQEQVADTVMTTVAEFTEQFYELLKDTKN